MNAHIKEIIDLLNAFDWILLTIVGISTLYGLFRGFIKEALTVTAWAFAAWLSYFYADSLAVYLEPHIETVSMRVALMVLALFVLVLSISSSIRVGMNYLIHRVGLLGLDFLLGALFGVLRGVLLSMLLIIALMNLGFSEDPWWKKSYLVEKLNPVFVSVADHLPSETRVVYERYALPVAA